MRRIKIILIGFVLFSVLALASPGLGLPYYGQGITVDDVTMLVKEKTATTIVTLKSAPKGLSGYKITIELSNCQIADITNVEPLLNFAPVDDGSRKTNCSWTMTAFDNNDTVGPGARDIQLARVTFTSSARTVGTSEINVIVQRMDDDDGASMSPDVESGTLFVQACPHSDPDVPIPLPRKSGPPNDTDGDLLCDDLNGNSRIDFDDAVTLAHCFLALSGKDDGPVTSKCKKAQADYTTAFNFDGEDALTFNDAVELAKIVAKTPVQEASVVSAATMGGASSQTEILSVGSESISIGDSVTVPIILSGAPNGLSGFAITATVGDKHIIAIEDVKLVAFDGAAYTDVGPQKAFILATDFEEKVQPEAQNVILARVQVRGLAGGTTTLRLQVTAIDGDDGYPLEIAIQDGTVTVSGDCSLLWDINGDGREDVDDTILFARAYLGLPGPEEDGLRNKIDPCLYDFDQNGDIDINDVIKHARVILGIDPRPNASENARAMDRSPRDLRSELSEAIFGEKGGTAYGLVLPDAPQGLAAYKIRLSTLGKIAGVELAALTGVAVEIAPDGKSALIAAVDLLDRVRPGAREVQLARVWAEGAVDVEVEALYTDSGSLSKAPLELRPLTVIPLVESSVLAYSTFSGITFAVEGQGIESVAVQIYDLAGSLVFDSGFVSGNALAWDMLDMSGSPVANGVYLYIVTVRGFNGEVVRSEVRKMVILR